jgi:hypothetical protein
MPMANSRPNHSQPDTARTARTIQLVVFMVRGFKKSAFILHLGAFTHDIEVAKAGDDPDDEAQVEKEHIIEYLREPIPKPAADGDGENQGKADGAGLVTTGEQFFEKLFGIFLQGSILGHRLGGLVQNLTKGIITLVL